MIFFFSNAIPTSLLLRLFDFQRTARAFLAGFIPNALSGNNLNAERILVATQRNHQQDPVVLLLFLDY